MNSEIHISENWLLFDERVNPRRARGIGDMRRLLFEILLLYLMFFLLVLAVATIFYLVVLPWGLTFRDAFGFMFVFTGMIIPGGLLLWIAVFPSDEKDHSKRSIHFMRGLSWIVPGTVLIYRIFLKTWQTFVPLWIIPVCFAVFLLTMCVEIWRD